MLDETKSERALSPQTRISNDFSPREVGAESSGVCPVILLGDDEESNHTVTITSPLEVTNVAGGRRSVGEVSSPTTHVDDASPAELTNHNGRSWRRLFGLRSASGDVKTQNNDVREQTKLIKRWKVALVEEAKLSELEQRLAAGDAVCDVLHEAPNFPPRFLCIAPLVHHDFDTVPAHRRRFVQLAFWTWFALCVLLVANMAIAVGTLYAPVKRGVRIDAREERKARSVVLAVVYLGGIPLAFILWYWRIYRASITHAPGEYVAAMCGIVLAFAQAIFAIVGPTGYGVCGAIYATYVARTRRAGVVAPVAVMCFFWLLLAIVIGIIAVRLVTFFRRDLHVDGDPIQ